jgi:hypothetical protein
MVTGRQTRHKQDYGSIRHLLFNGFLTRLTQTVLIGGLVRDIYQRDSVRTCNLHRATQLPKLVQVLVQVFDAGSGDSIGDVACAMSLEKLQALPRYNIFNQMGHTNCVSRARKVSTMRGMRLGRCHVGRVLKSFYSSPTTAVGTSTTVGPSTSGSMAPG